MSLFLPISLQQARQALLEGAPISDGLLPGPIHRSWERTRAAGVRPSDRALFQHIVTVPEMRRVQDTNQALINLAQPDMDHLWRSIRSPKWLVLLINPEGTIVHSIGDTEYAPREIRLPLRCGRRLVEGELGTNAPGVIASEPIPIEIRGDEHFLEELRRFTCAAAPIIGLDGRVAGILDITGFDVTMDMRALKRVLAASRSIEARMFEQAEDGILVRMHEDPRFIGTPAQGLMLVNDDGSVIAANHAAVDMLSLPTCAPISARTGTEIFDDPNWLAQALDASIMHGSKGGGKADAVFTQQGFRLFVQAEKRRRHLTITNASSQMPTIDLDPSWQNTFERASKIFPHGVPLLLQGETGTGKEVFARRLHKAHRPGRPFIAVNCAAIAEGIAESELFGYMDGTFTGGRKGGASGRIEQANGGTLFLDEIGDMPLHLQTRLLRVLQDRSTLRLGGKQEIELDILVVSASHQDLAQLVAKGRFREDLYFRLNGLKVCLPSLRERQDFGALVRECLLEQSPDPSNPSKLSQPLLIRLASYTWPGNIRQLNQMLRLGALLAGPGGEITEDMLPEEIATAIGEHSASPASDKHLSDSSFSPTPELNLPNLPNWLMAEKQRDWIELAIHQHSGNITATAKALGISRTTLYRYRNMGCLKEPKV